MMRRDVRFLVIAAILAGCGSSGSSDSARRSFNGPLILDPTLLCFGPACLGLHLESLRPGPVAPPVIQSRSLGPPGPPAIVYSTALQRASRTMAFASRTKALATPPPGCSSYSLGMQVLVIATDGKENDLPAIQQALGYHTIPFSTWVAAQNPGLLTADKLSAGCAGKYQGIILTTGGLLYSTDGGASFHSALTSAEWQALRSYEASFHVREISWYVNPSADQGLNPASASFDTTTSPIDATLTTAGKTVFPYVNSANPITITQAWTYLATPSDPNVTPLLVDKDNHALVSSRVTSDGRETMALTFDANPYLVHDLVLAHGLLEWLTTGIYLGEFRAYLTPQVDDLFIDDDMYFGGVYRITADDYNATHSWQVGQQANPGNSGFRLALAINGVGADPVADPLTAAVLATKADYLFINHTWDHENLDNADYAFAFAQIDQNNQFATSQGLPYTAANFVSPDVSGLTNPNAMAAARDTGVRFMVTDTSKPGWSNPAPNIGIYSSLEPSILLVPRRPTNLFYNVAVPDEWTAEYNSLYATYWGRALSYAEVLDKESQNLLIYMLQGEIDPHMYHQPNLRAYDGVRTLLGDLLDLTFQKFRRSSTLPVMSPDMQVAGARIASTMARNASGLTATLTPGVSVSFSSPVDVQFAVSGVCTTSSENYAGKCITPVHVTAGGTVTLPVQ